MATWEERMGRAAFEAYAKRLKELQEFGGAPVLGWDDLQPNIQTGWAAAARAVANKISAETPRR